MTSEPGQEIANDLMYIGSSSPELDTAMMIPFLTGLGTFLAAPYLTAAMSYGTNGVNFLSSKRPCVELICPPLSFWCVTSYISLRVFVLFIGCYKNSHFH